MRKHNKKLEAAKKALEDLQARSAGVRRARSCPRRSGGHEDGDTNWERDGLG